MRRAVSHLLVAFGSVLVIWTFWRAFIHTTQLRHDQAAGNFHLRHQPPSQTPPPEKMIVMGKLSIEDTDWVEESLSDWANTIYVVDNTSAHIHTKRNKGREANAYLTFIIDHYHQLPNISVFIHSHRAGYPEAWHTDAIGHDIVNGLNDLNINYIQQRGYMNLRCNPNPGCSGLVIEPWKHANKTKPLDRNSAAAAAWLEAWSYLNFTGEAEVPKTIAAACCAQFAVSREQILKRPVEDYIRYHEWLMNTRMSDEISGRIMEYSWHMMFGQEAVDCPAMMECYRNLYGEKNPFSFDINGGSLNSPQDRHGREAEDL